MNLRIVTTLSFPILLASVWAPSSVARAGDLDCSSADTKDRWVNALGPIEPASGNNPIKVFTVAAGGDPSDVCNIDPLNFGADCCSTATFVPGLTMAAANRLAVKAAVQAAVANWNSVSAETKPFFFVSQASFPSDDYNSLENFDPDNSAVYVSAACFSHAGETTSCGFPTCNGSAVGVDFKKRIQIGSRACGHDWTITPDRDADSDPTLGHEDDLYGTVMHEFGHALGLRHTDGTQSGCPLTENSVMNPLAATGGMKQYRRMPRRADIENLRERYADVPERDIFLAEKTFFETAAINATGLTWNVLSPSTPIRTNTPPVTTNAHDSDSWYTVIGFTNTRDQVAYTTGEFGIGYNFDSPGVIFPPNNTPAKTFDRVAVNWGAPLGAVNKTDTRIMMAWYEGETNNSWGFGHRWAIRNFGSNTQTHSNMISGSGPFNPKSGFGIGVDVQNEQFIFLHADNDYQLVGRFVDMATGTPGPVFTPAGAGLKVLGIGSPSCVLNGTTTNCAIPVNAIGGLLLGPCAAWVNGSISSSGVWTFNNTTFDEECAVLDTSMRFSSSAPSLASDFRDGTFESETHLAGFASPGDNDEHVFKATDGATDGWVVQSPLTELTLRNTQGWPVAVGSNTADNDMLNYRMVSAVAQ